MGGGSSVCRGQGGQLEGSGFKFQCRQSMGGVLVAGGGTSTPIEHC